MHRSPPSFTRAAACAIFGFVLIVAAAVPSRDARSDLPRAVTRAMPLPMWLARVPPIGVLGPEETPRIVELAGRSPERAGTALDVSLRRCLRVSPSLGHLARTIRGIADPDAEVSMPRQGSAADELPVRRIAALGERAAAVHRVSAENASRFPIEVKRALIDLIRAAERSHHLVEQLLQTRDPTGLRAADLEAALSASVAVDLSDLALAAAPPRNDLDAWIDAAIELADAMDRARDELGARVDLSGLRSLPDGDGIPRNVVFASECDAGLVVVGGAGTTVMPLHGVAVAIDLSGDDVWHADAAFGAIARDTRITLAIDVAGADAWRGGARGVALACDGVIVIADHSGDDVYEGGASGLGAAWNGASLLVDFDGNDRYSVDRFGMGFGAFGAGMIADLAGDDVYRGDLAVLGVGAMGGLGAFLDSAGDDLYITDLAGRSRGAEFSAGASCAIAGIGGGVGFFVDRAGSDTYRLAKSGGGSALGGGVAAFFDCEGDDLYGGAERCFGAGRSRGLGLMRDFSGDDDYLARGNSIGCGSGGTGVFVDDSGRDSTLALDPCKGAVEGGGFSIFADVDALPTLRSDDRRPRRR